MGFIEVFKILVYVLIGAGLVVGALSLVVRALIWASDWWNAPKDAERAVAEKRKSLGY